MVNKDDLVQLFPQFEKALVNEIHQQASLKKIKAGELVLKVGQVIRSVMFLKTGVVKLYRTNAAGKEFFIYYLVEGEVCVLSLVSAIKREKCDVLAKALTDAVIITIPLECMDKWIRKFSSWYLFVLQSYRSHFEELLKAIDAIAFTNMDERLKNYLKKHVDTIGKGLKLTHQQIADDLNTSREVISRLLKKMELSGTIVTNRGFIKWAKDPHVN